MEEENFDTVPFAMSSNISRYEQIFLEEQKESVYQSNDQTIDQNYNLIVANAESENILTTSQSNIESKASKKQYHQKNSPKLFGKQLNTLSRNNIHFNKKKDALLNYDQIKIKNFNKWLDENVLDKLHNIKAYKEIWTINEKDEDVEFKEIFRELSILFFSKFAVRYIANSNIKDNEQKKIYLKLIPKYLRGIERPEIFNRMI